MNALEQWSKANGWSEGEVLRFLWEYGVISDNCLNLAEVVNFKEALIFVKGRIWAFSVFARSWRTAL